MWRAFPQELRWEKRHSTGRANRGEVSWSSSTNTTSCSGRWALENSSTRINWPLEAALREKTSRSNSWLRFSKEKTELAGSDQDLSLPRLFLRLVIPYGQISLRETQQHWSGWKTHVSTSALLEYFCVFTMNRVIAALSIKELIFPL